MIMSQVPEFSLDARQIPGMLLGPKGQIMGPVDKILSRVLYLIIEIFRTGTDSGQ
jgi:hypothetical protein